VYLFDLLRLAGKKASTIHKFENQQTRQEYITMFPMQYQASHYLEMTDPPIISSQEQSSQQQQEGAQHPAQHPASCSYTLGQPGTPHPPIVHKHTTGPACKESPVPHSKVLSQ
jgi:hypothetical protein